MIDWNPYLPILIPAVVTLLGAIALYLRALTNKINEVHSAVNTNYQAMIQTLAATNVLKDALTRRLSDTQIANASLEEKLHGAEVLAAAKAPPIASP